MVIGRIDHVVFNCRDVEAMAAWYGRVLGFEREEFFGPIQRIAFKFGNQKINLRPTGADDWMTGDVDAPGSIDICFVTEAGIEAAVDRLQEENVDIIRGPVTQKGALGEMTSVYFRDPEGNLLEIASYAQGDLGRRMQRPKLSATIATSATDDRSWRDGKLIWRRLIQRFLYTNSRETIHQNEIRLLRLDFWGNFIFGVVFGSLTEYWFNFLTEPVAFVSGLFLGFSLFW